MFDWWQGNRNQFSDLIKPAGRSFLSKITHKDPGLRAIIPNRSDDEATRGEDLTVSLVVSMACFKRREGKAWQIQYASFWQEVTVDEKSLLQYLDIDTALKG